MLIGEPHLDVFRTETDSFGNAGLTTFRAGLDVRYMEYWGESGVMTVGRLHHAARDDEPLFS